MPEILPQSPLVVININSNPITGQPVMEVHSISHPTVETKREACLEEEFNKLRAELAEAKTALAKMANEKDGGKDQSKEDKQRSKEAILNALKEMGKAGATAVSISTKLNFKPGKVSRTLHGFARYAVTGVVKKGDTFVYTKA